ncbi:MAG: glycosyltransferase, partial [Atribacterota bacterium]
MKNQPKTESLILIPIYNEQKHIFNVLREVRKHSPEDLLVINDGSTDESKEIVEEIASCAKLKGKLFIINHSENEGYGKSLI